MEITQQQLKEILHYDPETGIFRWRHARKNNQIKPWGLAGSISSTGYINIEINNRSYKAHRLAWLYVTGSLPYNQIDHFDGIRNNNCFSNLRSATNKQNMENQQLMKTNTSGYRGVYKRGKTWRAYVTHNGKRSWLGSFKSAEEAAKVAAAKRVELFTHYTGRDQH